MLRRLSAYVLTLLALGFLISTWKVARKDHQLDITNHRAQVAHDRRIQRLEDDVNRPSPSTLPSVSVLVVTVPASPTSAPRAAASSTSAAATVPPSSSTTSAPARPTTSTSSSSVPPPCRTVPAVGICSPGGTS